MLIHIFIFFLIYLIFYHIKYNIVMEGLENLGEYGGDRGEYGGEEGGDRGEDGDVDLNDLDNRSKSNTSQIETIRTYIKDLKKKNMNKE